MKNIKKIMMLLMLVAGGNLYSNEFENNVKFSGHAPESAPSSSNAVSYDYQAINRKCTSSNSVNGTCPGDLYCVKMANDPISKKPKYRRVYENETGSCQYSQGK